MPVLFTSSRMFSSRDLYLLSLFLIFKSLKAAVLASFVTSDAVLPMPMPMMTGGQHLVTLALTSSSTRLVILSCPIEGFSMERYEQFSLPPPFSDTDISSPGPVPNRVEIRAGVLFPVFTLSYRGSFTMDLLRKLLL